MTGSSIPGDTAPHLLLIDDDNRIRELLQRFLGEQGFRVTVAKEAAEARRRMQGLQFDLLILDVMMPGESGLELAQDIRRTSDVPILMLTARSETDDRIMGLEAGVDDYLPKPFEPRELLLRISAILRRGGPKQEIKPETITFGPYQYNPEREELKRGEDYVRLTDREKQFLNAFAAKPGQTVTRADLVGDDSTLGERTVDVQVNRLRRKIEEDPSNPFYLQTVRGVGYRLITD
ncbi:response regulator [Pseudovibrio exalbescens]|uniref:DNA-binding response regulator n=1 Tax=Pseudovibrio exalbescens TaxID=197461 RepID=A0A1U7JL98_9HYPH|nr:response regulator transcription factor [Pseudovibrio exalbescens]OKL45499.1 DNA-binding response regulator [Pseudovibrio exalbescens]